MSGVPQFSGGGVGAYSEHFPTPELARYYEKVHLAWEYAKQRSRKLCEHFSLVCSTQLQASNKSTE
jgi:hypothetical protein